MFTKSLCQKKLEFICFKLGGVLEERIGVNKLYGYFGLCIQSNNIYIYGVRGRKQCDYRAPSSILFSCKP
jgi:hypothetical protein